MSFTKVTNIPKGRTASYLRVAVAMRPEKANPRRVRWTVGGDRIDYPDNVSTKTADLTTAKLFIKNSTTLSTPNEPYMTADIKDNYLGTPMSRFENMSIPIDMLPDQYNLRPMFHNGFVYVEIQAGRLANDQLIAFLAPPPAIAEFLSSLVSGATTPKTLSSAWSSTILACVTRHAPTPTISSPPSKPLIKSAPIGLDLGTAG
jgi:hypothetical protein